MIRNEMRLLLIDADPRVGAAIRPKLSAPARVWQVKSIAEATALAAQVRPALVLMDARMVGGAGSTALERLQEEPALRDVPVLLNDAPSSDGSLRPTLPPEGKAERWHAVLSGHAGGRDTESARLLALVLEKRAPRLLIVDDDPAAVHAMHSVLVNLGADVLFATKGEDALALAVDRQPDLILLDIQIPGFDGFEVCRRLQVVAPNLPVIFITRFSDAGHEARAFELGGVDFIRKPFSPNVLLARIQRALRGAEEGRAAVRAEREHWQSVCEARVAQILDNASDAIVSVDAEGRVVLANRAACVLFVMPAAEIVGKHLLTLLGHSELVSPLDFETGQRLVFVRADGEHIPLELFPSIQGEGRERVMTLTLCDLTLREQAVRDEQARVEAEAASEEKSKMLSYLVHEIAVPLGQMVGLGQLIEEDAAYPLPPRQSERVSLIMAGAYHLRALMQDALDLKSFASGQLCFEPVVVDAVAELRESGEAWAEEAARANIQLVVQSASAALPIHVDPLRLRQCLYNLLSNAIKYGRAQSILELSARRLEGSVEIAVCDEGVGMSSEQVEHLFEPFDQRGREGTGIGLALTRELVVGMGGRISVQSELDHGTRFCIEFPLAQRTTSQAPKQEAAR
jgi:PAS domain S-box-containing protein